jgi:hypothetical protein
MIPWLDCSIHQSTDWLIDWLKLLWDHINIYNINIATLIHGLWCLTPLSTIFQLYRGSNINIYNHYHDQVNYNLEFYVTNKSSVHSPMPTLICSRHWYRGKTVLMLLPRYNWNIVESGVKHHKPCINVAILMLYILMWSH